MLMPNNSTVSSHPSRFEPSPSRWFKMFSVILAATAMAVLGVSTRPKLHGQQGSLAPLYILNGLRGRRLRAFRRIQDNPGKEQHSEGSVGTKVDETHEFLTTSSITTVTSTAEVVPPASLVDTTKEETTPKVEPLGPLFASGEFLSNPSLPEGEHDDNGRSLTTRGDTPATMAPPTGPTIQQSVTFQLEYGLGLQLQTTGPLPPATQEQFSEMFEETQDYVRTVLQQAFQTSTTAFVLQRYSMSAQSITNPQRVQFEMAVSGTGELTSDDLEVVVRRGFQQVAAMFQYTGRLQQALPSTNPYSTTLFVLYYDASSSTTMAPVPAPTPHPTPAPVPATPVTLSAIFQLEYEFSAGQQQVTQLQFEEMFGITNAYLVSWLRQSFQTRLGFNFQQLSTSARQLSNPDFVEYETTITGTGTFVSSDLEELIRAGFTVDTVSAYTTNLQLDLASTNPYRGTVVVNYYDAMMTRAPASSPATGGVSEQGVSPGSSPTTPPILRTFEFFLDYDLGSSNPTTPDQFGAMYRLTHEYIKSWVEESFQSTPSFVLQAMSTSTRQIVNPTRVRYQTSVLGVGELSAQELGNVLQLRFEDPNHENGYASLLRDGLSADNPYQSTVTVSFEPSPSN